MTNSTNPTAVLREALAKAINANAEAMSAMVAYAQSTDSSVEPIDHEPLQMLQLSAQEIDRHVKYFKHVKQYFIASGDDGTREMAWKTAPTVGEMSKALKKVWPGTDFLAHMSVISAYRQRLFGFVY